MILLRTRSGVRDAVLEICDDGASILLDDHDDDRAVMHVTRADLVTLRDNLTKYLDDAPKPVCEDVNCPCPDCNDWTGQHQVLSKQVHDGGDPVR